MNIKTMNMSVFLVIMMMYDSHMLHTSFHDAFQV